MLIRCVACRWRLPLMRTVREEFLLPVLDNDTGWPSAELAGHAADTALGCTLPTSPALNDRVDTDVERLFVVNPGPVGTPALDRALAQIRSESEARSADHWVRAFASERCNLLEAQLIYRLVDGVFMVRGANRRLWLLDLRGGAASEGEPPVEVRRCFVGVPVSDEVPGLQDIVIISPAEIRGLWRGLIDESGLARLAPKARQLTRFDLIGPAVARVMDRDRT